ncbi:TetR/AcrR family transcriptional regulator [Okibacterium fritillariae]|uniref:Transcriptional regulator, TetR family n=1 Tax=Okibacterium fritillariae TaxID=123320 RepID=A0A1T5IIT8_9MICO|nr:TetR/AcrR family transcriptional regulator [Okibacterium fritillariae]SKC39057.1 transcriptional regulator, TetR family [Okibacterium fritillariae]
MGRQQVFDTVHAVEAARDLFWQLGYEAVSLTDLERATGLNRSSIYNAFGSKRGLFDVAVENYLETIIRPRIAPLLDPSNSPSAAADALIRYFTALAETVAALPADSPRQGCLLVTAAPGIAGQDETVRQVVADYHSELVGAFTAALERAGGAQAGEVQVAAAQDRQTHADRPSDPKSVSRARLLASLSVSAFALAKVDRGESIVLLHTGADFATEWTEAAHLQRF